MIYMSTYAENVVEWEERCFQCGRTKWPLIHGSLVPLDIIDERIYKPTHARNEYQVKRKLRYKYRRQLGLCVQCIDKVEALEGKAQCVMHLAKSREWIKTYRKRGSTRKRRASKPKG